MSSRKATESFCFVHTTQYIYEEDNKSALERLGRQATFKFRALRSVRDGKGLSEELCVYSRKELGNEILTMKIAGLWDVTPQFLSD